MAKNILLPQEIETFYIIPTIRRYFSKYLKEKGMKQKEIASILGISSSSISQYTSNKRAHKLDFPLCILQSIQNSAKKISNQQTYIKEMQHLLSIIRNQKVLCKIHQKFADIPDNCDPIKMGCIHS